VVVIAGRTGLAQRGRGAVQDLDQMAAVAPLARLVGRSDGLLVAAVGRERGEVFRLPAPLIRSTGARVMGLDDPTTKMSKSTALTRPGHAILLLDSPDVVRRKIGRATTDTNPAVTEPVGAGVANLLDIHAAVRGHSRAETIAQFEGAGYGALKAAVTDAINEVLEPVQTWYGALRADETALRSVLQRGAERAAAVADATLLRVQDAVGLR